MAMKKIEGTERMYYDAATKTIYERMENGDFNPVRIGGAALVSHGNAAIGTVGAISISALADLIEFSVAGYSRIFVEIAVATAALTGFVIQARAHADASYQTLYSVAADYTADPLQGLLEGTSGDLTIIGAGATGWFIMDVRGIESVKLRASSGGTAGVTVRGTKEA